MFYLNDIITMCEGEKITGCTTQMLGLANRSLLCMYADVRVSAGVIQCIPNAKNPRDLDISLQYSFKGKHMACTTSQQFRMR